MQRQSHDTVDSYTTCSNYHSNNSLNTYEPLQIYQHQDEPKMESQSNDCIKMGMRSQQQYAGYSHGRNVKRIKFEDAFF